MADIAAALGLHRRTVSAVINGTARQRRISEETIARVEAYLQQTGYVPSRQARDLRAGGQQRQVLGILLQRAFYRYLTADLQLFFPQLHGRPMEIVVSSGKDNVGGLQELAARRCSRLLWLQVGGDRSEIRRPEVLLPLLQNFDRIVVHNYRFGFGRHAQDLLDAGAHLVGVDRYGAMRRIGQLLQDLGHRRIAFLFENDGAAMIGELTALGLEVHWVAGTTTDETSLAKFTPDLGERFVDCCRRHRVTAAIFNNDQSAMAGLLAAQEQGWQVPQDLTMVAWEGSVYAEGLTVPLTTMDLPVNAMVQRSLKLLESDEQPTRHIFPAELHLRGSHGPA